MQMHSTYEIHCNLRHVLESKTYTAYWFRGFLFRMYSVWLMGIMFTGPARRGKKPEKTFERLNRPWKDCIVLLPYLWWASSCSGAKLLETQYESCDTYCVLAYKSGEWTATTTHLSSMKPNMQQFAFRLSVLTFPFFFCPVWPGGTHNSTQPNPEDILVVGQDAGSKILGSNG